MKAPRTIRELLKDGKFYTWQSENIESMGYSRSESRRDRYGRCHDAATDGADGSTHGENIEDFREYASMIFSDLERALDRSDLEQPEYDRELAELEAARAALDADIDRCEKWHADHNTLDEQVS